MHDIEAMGKNKKKGKSRLKSTPKDSNSPSEDSKRAKCDDGTDESLPRVQDAHTPQSTPSNTRSGEPSYARIQKKFLTEEDGVAFSDLVKDHYNGFVHVPGDQVQPSNFHVKAKAALQHLRDANYYQYDIVMAGGKHTSRTFVKRTLVGDPGITYKYLGLRLFAHAWSGPGVLPVMKTIGELNQHMIDMTRTYKDFGQCNYNLTLINFMEPSSHSKIGLKDEAFYGMGKVSVSWHADSSLHDNSSIGVYHCLPTQKKSKWDWRIALRKTPTTGTLEHQQVLPIAVSTKDCDAYFLLGTFNETHQHCVLSGSEANRISSTHRVAVTAEDTFEYIRKRAKGAIKRMKQALDGDITQVDPKVIVFCQRVLSEVEMDWIAQYWLQGLEHDKMHVWWQKPMQTLELLWLTLEELTFQLYEKCISSPERVPRLAVKGFLLELESRQNNREQWDLRREDKIYQRRIAPGFRPVARPMFDPSASNRLNKNLEVAIAAISKVRKRQLEVEMKTEKIKPTFPTGTGAIRNRSINKKWATSANKRRGPNTRDDKGPSKRKKH